MESLENNCFRLAAIPEDLLRQSGFQQSKSLRHKEASSQFLSQPVKNHAATQFNASVINPRFFNFHKGKFNSHVKHIKTCVGDHACRDVGISFACSPPEPYDHAIVAVKC
jgi:hypothetical protein